MFPHFAIKKGKVSAERKTSSCGNTTANLHGRFPTSPANVGLQSAMRDLFDALDRVTFDSDDTGEYRLLVPGEGAHDECKELLNSLMRVADQLGVKPQNRQYREEFSKNYKALFPSESWHYRLDVLEAAQQGHNMIAVNGERYDFNVAVLQSGRKLKESWRIIFQMLHYLRGIDYSASYTDWKTDIVPLLVDLDCKWVDFEQEYIFELIRIEKMARRFVTEVIDWEWCLVTIEREMQKVEVEEGKKDALDAIKKQYNEARLELVKTIGRLNAVANNRGKGRDDFTLLPLQAAESILQRQGEDVENPFSAVSILASDCVESLENFRRYIRRLSNTPEKIDPHLINNTILVSHLVKIEESWERSQKYLHNPQKLLCLISIVQFLAAIIDAQRSVEEGFILRQKSDNSTTATPCLVSSAKSSRCGATLLFRPTRRSQRNTFSTFFCAGKDLKARGAQNSQLPTQDEHEPTCTGLSLCGNIATSDTHLHLSSNAMNSDVQALRRQGRFYKSTEIIGKNENFEEKLMACDVDALIALPRFICFYYLLDPINRLYILQSFLPEFNTAEAGECNLETTPSFPASTNNSAFYLAMLGRIRENGDGTLNIEQEKPSLSPEFECSSESPYFLSSNQNETHSNAKTLSKLDDFDTNKSCIGGATLGCCKNYNESESQNGNNSASTLTEKMQERSTSDCYCEIIRSTQLGKYVTVHSDVQDRNVPRFLKELMKYWTDLLHNCTAAQNCCGRIKILLCLVSRLMDSDDHETTVQNIMGFEYATIQDSINILFQHIEKISMSLQRSCPRDWNDFLHVLLLCLQNYRKITQVDATMISNGMQLGNNRSQARLQENNFNSHSFKDEGVPSDSTSNAN
ncbi:hypothetical protein IE077_001271 [Cardiosporidium cionae]|uniref:Uncharacterized protein n=1 Tax=Cardiosporidium cionae TaxID=476202 RepID=A0ABQ7J5L6_9APIC|nr:hypothetical protein IE077_001271 [Cardiosporidium cionae]|eukprot:KAF8819276.1 hypothetical protein IE077_001271 [Cardiosporidium cionae]